MVFFTPWQMLILIGDNMYKIPSALIFYISISVVFASNGIKFEESFEKDNFIVKNALVDDTRYFQGEGQEIINASLEKVLVEVLDFSGRCNQDHVRRRKETSKKFKCRFHNPSLVESVMIRDFKKQADSKKYLDEFILWRNVYNRNAWQYYDHVTVTQLDANAKNILVRFEMMEEEKVKKYLINPKKRDTAFLTTGGEYYITSLGKNKTKVKMIYFSSTDHWLLSSGMAKGQIVEKIAEGSLRTLNSIKTGSTKL